MPVRKTAAKKTATPAKKTAKSAAPALAKKVAAAKKTAESNPEESAAKRIIAAIESGAFDGYLNQFDAALTKRINEHVVENQKAKTTAKSASSSTPSEKKVAPPPKKAKKTVTITPEQDGEYKVSDRLASLAGAKVKFIRFKADSDGKKSVVEMLTGKPGSPKGKRVVIPTSALEESGDVKKKRAVKKK